MSDLWGLTGRVSSVMAFRIAVATLPGCRESSGHVAAAARLYELAHRTRRAFIVGGICICKRSVRSIYRRWSLPLRREQLQDLRTARATDRSNIAMEKIFLSNPRSLIVLFLTNIRC